MVEREGTRIMAYHRGFRAVAVGNGEDLAGALADMDAAMKLHIARIGGRLL